MTVHNELFVDTEIQKTFARLYKKRIHEILNEILSERCIGTLAYVYPEYILPENVFERRLDILHMFEKGFFYYLRHFHKTNYYQHLKSRLPWSVVMRKIFKYYKLYTSIKRHGFRFDPQNTHTMPWLFCARGLHYRLDGHHRTSVSWFLGYESLPAIVVTPADLFKENNLPMDIIEYLKTLQEPELQHIQPIESKEIQSLKLSSISIDSR